MLRFLAFWCAAPVWAGCVAFAPSPQGSKCAPSDAALRWVNPPAENNVRRHASRSFYDAVLGDPSFQAGREVKGRMEFELRAAGPHLLEVFLINPEIDRFTFRLAVEGKTADARPPIAPGPGRLRPKRGLRYTTLLARVNGPLRFSVDSEAPAWELSAVRWTPLAVFERSDVPRYRERARWLNAHILLEKDGDSPMARRQYLQQLGDRLVFSADPAARKEGLLDRTRAWFWLAAENHEPDDLLQTSLLFEEGLRVMPESPILRQMISSSCSGQINKRMPSGAFCSQAKPVPWTVPDPPAPAGAPEWAVWQRRLMRRMDALTRWWVEKRQADNGELGGAWGDDVEILRYWGPQALGFGSEVAARGIMKEVAGIWTSGTLRDGYYRSVSDVEHSSEPTTDTLPLSAALLPHDKEVLSRLASTTACADSWLAVQPDGAYRFRSSWFNCREADTSPARAVDVHLNVRAIGPALWYAYLTRDKKVTGQIARWADAWIASMRSVANGKPRGMFPPVVRSADGHYLIGSDRWDKPDAEWDYFQWSGGSQEALTSLVLAAYELTGDRKYLQAAGESFEPLLDCGSRREMCAAVAGSPEAFRVWRKLADDTRFDRAFGYRKEPAAEELLGSMAAMARQTCERLSVNFDIFTSEVLYTDRVYYPMPTAYRDALFGGEAPRGDRYPTFAVTWPAVQAEFARAVLAASPERVAVRLYSFDKSEGRTALRLWRLRPGDYTWRAGSVSGVFKVARLPHDLTVPLPAGKEVDLVVEKKW